MLLRTISFAIAISLGAATLAGSTLAESNFLADVDDLPLPEGLVEDAGARMVFDKPEGRIVDTAAAGPGDARQVRSFYARTLPALGWQSRGEGIWQRDDENMELTVAQDGARVVVRFLVTPAGR